MQKNKLKYQSFFFLALLMLVGCNNSDDTFMGLLYQLADVQEEKREEMFQTWLNKKEKAPIIENNKVFFIYQNVKDVSVFVSGEMNSWKPDADQMMRIIGTSYYYFEQSYPADARVEYKFVVEGEYILDPLNEQTSAGGYGSNSLILMPEYKFPAEILVNRFQNYTRIDTFVFNSNILPGERNVFIYSHPLADNNSPIIIFNDGADYLNFGLTNTVLDNLIEKDKIPACHAFFVNPGNRMKEYWLNDDYHKLLFDELIPKLKQDYKFTSDNKIFVGGVSLGGLTAYHSLKKYSSQIDGVFGQSPSFWLDSLQIIDELRDVDLDDTKLFFDYGLFEEDSYDSTVIEFFKQKSKSFQFEKYNEGHAWGNWMGHLDSALIYLLTERKGI
ncbi:MAG: hypothetical protein D8M58_16820 [Calditrichaeota bacterium]|nr:MAG: hypothetical protein DWQ03_11950 [Calditrichota bacterium]MBL1207070.1 hypothetical protein [Calditrichota bacterium]NOG46900.1 hypothetical protein [Calditrichota bacterium]